MLIGNYFVRITQRKMYITLRKYKISLRRICLAFLLAFLSLFQRCKRTDSKHHRHSVPQSRRLISHARKFQVVDFIAQMVNKVIDFSYTVAVARYFLVLMDSIEKVLHPSVDPCGHIVLSIVNAQ